MKNNLLFNEKALDLKFSKEIKHLANISSFNNVRSIKKLGSENKTRFIILQLIGDALGPVTLTVLDPAFERADYRYTKIPETPTENTIEDIMNGLSSIIDSKNYFVSPTRYQSLQLFKLFLIANNCNEEEVRMASLRYAEGTKAKYNKVENTMDEAVIKYNVSENIEIGITKVIGDTLELYKLDKTKKQVVRTKHTIYEKFNNDYDIKEEVEFQKDFDKFRFLNDTDYKNIILNQVKEISQEAYDELNTIQETVFSLYKFYPTEWFSTGSIAKAILSYHFSESEDVITTENEVQLDFTHHYESWLKAGNDMTTLNNSILMVQEAMSGGAINIYKQGTFSSLSSADINSCYSSVFRAIPDIRGAKFNLVKPVNMKGFNEIPKPIKNKKLVVVTAKVFLDDSITHTFNQKVTGTKFGREFFDNVNLNGLQVVTGIFEEFEMVYLQSKTAIKEILEYVEINVKGNLNPFSKVIDKIFKERQIAIKKGDVNKSYILKLVLNSIYGLTLETHAQTEINYDTDSERAEDKILFKGQKTGGYYNPFYGLYINAMARIRLIEAKKIITVNGGEVVQELTDALIWSGVPEMLPENFPSLLRRFDGLEQNGHRQKKILGFFEEPKQLTEGVSLGVGFYEYKNPNGIYTTKTMGIELSKEPGEAFLNKRLSYLKQLEVSKTSSRRQKLITRLTEVKELLKNAEKENQTAAVIRYNEMKEELEKEINYSEFKKLENEVTDIVIKREHFRHEQTGNYCLPFLVNRLVTPKMIINEMIDEYTGEVQVVEHTKLGNFLEIIDQRDFKETLPKKVRAKKEGVEFSIAELIDHTFELINPTKNEVELLKMGKGVNMEESEFDEFMSFFSNDFYDSRLHDYFELIENNLNDKIYIKKPSSKKGKSSSKQKKVTMKPQQERYNYYLAKLGPILGITKIRSNNKEEITIKSLGFNKLKELMAENGLEIEEGY